MEDNGFFMAPPEVCSAQSEQLYETALLGDIWNMN